MLRDVSFENVGSGIHDKSDKYTEASRHYREISDARSSGSRRTGLLSGVEEALADPNIVTVTVEGFDVPAIVPLEYAKEGAHYEVERCGALLGPENQGLEMFYYAAPPRLDDGELLSIQPKIPLPDSGCIFIDYNERDEVTPENLRVMLEAQGYRVGEVPFLNDTEEKPFGITGVVPLALAKTMAKARRTQEAEITLHVLDHQYADLSDERTLTELVDPYTKGPEEGGKAWGDINSEKGGVRLIMGNNVDEELLASLWDIYENKFDTLGQAHPLRMEDIEKDSLDLLQSEKTVISVYYKDGKPTSFSFSTEGTEQLDWMNQSFLEETLSLKEGERALFLPAIVSKEQDFSHAKNVIQLMTKMLYDEHAPFKIFFECTNKTKNGIPTILKRYSEEVGAMIERPVQVDLQRFKCFKFERNDEEEGGHNDRHEQVELPVAA